MASGSLTRLRNRLVGGIFGGSNQQQVISGPDISRGNKPNFDTSHFGETKDKFQHAIFQYPEDLGSNEFGHYMLFHIHQRTSSKYVSPQFSLGARSFGFAAAGFTALSPFDDDYIPSKPPKAEEGLTYSSKPAYNSDIQEDFRLAPEERPGFTSSASIAKRGGFTKSTDTIALYMPNNITDKVKVNYKNDETDVAGIIGNTFGGTTGIDEFMTQLVSNESGRTIASTVGEVLGVQGFLRAGSVVGMGNAIGQFRKAMNETPNPALEALFESMDFRDFQYQFRFTPRSENEVRIVDDIIRLFKFHAAPERMTGEKIGRHFRFPSEFDIFYMYQGQESKWYPMLHTCVLNNIDIQYGPGNETQHFRPVDGSPAPTEINMTLQFTETEVNTKEMIKLGF